MSRRKPDECSAEFLWPFKKDSVEEAAYEFANAATRPYQEIWWGLLKERMAERLLNKPKSKGIKHMRFPN